ncbi:MAG: hypothetical protein NTV34_07835 [Proteobacteria bacterium]|nr:hypothetical protein [Pseudomonadota bacterium]
MIRWPNLVFIWIAVVWLADRANAHVAISPKTNLDERKYLFFKAENFLERYTCPKYLVNPTPQSCAVSPVVFASASSVLAYRLEILNDSSAATLKLQKVLVSAVDAIDVKITGLLNYDPALSNQRVRIAELEVNQAQAAVLAAEGRFEILENQMNDLSELLGQVPGNGDLITEHNRLLVAITVAGLKRDQCEAYYLQKRGEFSTMIPSQQSDELLLALKAQREEQMDMLARVNERIAKTADKILQANKFYTALVFDPNFTFDFTRTGPHRDEAPDFEAATQLIDDFERVRI